jgi:serine/threonine-protein kinase
MSRVADTDLAPGSVVDGRYRIVRWLSQGASGRVYVAERLDSAQRIALKMIHPHLVRDRQVSRRFEREARILTTLRCDNLVPVLDWGTAGEGMLYMALELVEGVGLDAIIKRGAVDAEHAARYVQQICRALQAAHDAGVVHRDLKPSNVIVEGEGLQESLRVVDFGLAKVLRGTSDSLTVLTQQDMVFGTPEYMAPEQARGDEVDARCDVYAAGVILYELCTGHVPFRAETPIGVMTAHLIETPAPPSSRAPPGHVSPALESVVLNALAKDPNQRYPSARALAEALEAAMRRPTDVMSTLPPQSPEAELPYRDTLLALPPVRAVPALVSGSSRIWIFVAVAALAVSVAAGVALSLWVP